MICVFCSVAVLCGLAAGANGGDSGRPIEAAARAAAEKVLGYVLDTDVAMESLRFDRDGQFVEVGRFRVANPKGFAEREAIVVEKMRIEADLKSLFTNEAVVRMALIDGAETNAEIDPIHGVNLKKLLDNATRFKTPKWPQAKTEKLWRIDNGVIDHCAVNVATQLLERQTTRKDLDRIEMSIVGKDGKGLPANEVVAVVLKAILDKTGLLADTGVGQIPGDVVSPLLELIRK